jgi:hypothetical protein
MMRSGGHDDPLSIDLCSTSCDLRDWGHLIRNYRCIITNVLKKKPEPAISQQLGPASPNLVSRWQSGLFRILEGCLDCPALRRWKGCKHMSETPYANTVEKLVWDHAN